jgi:hypothetical protein
MKGLRTPSADPFGLDCAALDAGDCASLDVGDVGDLGDLGDPGDPGSLLLPNLSAFLTNDTPLRKSRG